ncbi:MAG: tetratricopeptide repeat protein [Magnetococcales bacterium]|nr:tetratricopeptide repeat protein [Magnetococcales bacterium]
MRAGSSDSPWQPFIDASWSATTPDEYMVAEQIFDKISNDGNKLPQNNLKFIWGLNRVASFYHTEGNSKAEERFLARSFRLQESKLGKKNPMLATHLQQLAHVWLKQKEYTRAKQALERALKLIEDNFGTKHILTINILEDLVKISAETGKSKDAELWKQKIRKQLTDSIPSNSTAKAVLQAEEAEIKLLAGDVEQAVVLQKSALDIYMGSRGPFHLARIKLLLSLAKSSQKDAKYEEAIEYLKGALAISENIQGLEHPHLVPILIQMAKNYQLIGKPAMGRPILSRSLTLLEKKYKNSPNHQEIATTLLVLADNFRLDNQPDLAISIYNRALTILQTKDSSSNLIAKTIRGLAHSLYVKGNIISAEENNRQALEMLVKINGAGTALAIEALQYQQKLVAEMVLKHQPSFIMPKKRKEKIRLIQARLTAIGINPGPIDGYIGPKTTKAIVDYNTKIGLFDKNSGKKISFDETIAHLPPVKDWEK